MREDYVVTRMTCPGWTLSIAANAAATTGRRSSSALLAASSTTTPRLPLRHVLLVFEVLVARHEDGEAGRLGRSEQRAVLQPSP